MVSSMAGGGPSAESSSYQDGRFPESSVEASLLSQQNPYWTRPNSLERLPLGLVTPPGPNMHSVVERRRDGLDILIPPVKWTSFSFIVAFTFALIWNIAVWSMLVGIISDEHTLGIFPTIFILPFILVGGFMFRQLLEWLKLETHIFIGYNDYLIQRIKEEDITREHKGQIRNIVAVQLTTKVMRQADEENRVSEIASIVCEIVEPGVTTTFGENLVKMEQEWLLREIGAFMTQVHNNNVVSNNNNSVVSDPSTIGTSNFSGSSKETSRESFFPSNWEPSPT